MPAVEEASSLNFEQYWAILCRRRWWIIGPAFVIWLVVLVVSWMLPERYRSQTVILIEQQKVPEDFVKPNVSVDLQARLQSMRQEILSRTRLLSIIDSFRLYGKERGYSDRDALVERMRDDITIELVVAPARPNELSAFKISYSALSPTVAQQVTGELTSVFITENLRSREQLSENTTAFLEAQLEEARERLSKQEERLREFKSRYLGELPEQVQSNVQILAGLQARYQATTEALNQAEQKKLYLESLLNQYRALPSKAGDSGESSSPSLPALERKLAQLKAELNNLSGQYTPMHPDLIRIKEQIASTQRIKEQLERDINTAREKEKEQPGSTATTESVYEGDSSPVLQLRGQVRANALEIANRKSELKLVETQMGQYQSRLNLTPMREQQLADITRDHQQSRSNYDSLLAKKQQSEMATSLEKRQQGEQFRIIDPPSLPQRPYWPNRFQFSLAGFAAGLFLAAAGVLLLEHINPRIDGEQDVRDVVPAPILGGIPTLYAAREEQQLQRRYWLEAAAALFLCSAIPLVTAFLYLKA